MINKMQDLLQKQLENIKQFHEIGDDFSEKAVTENFFARVKFCEDLGLNVEIANWKVTITEK